jgi:hypothetical protein
VVNAAMAETACPICSHLSSDSGSTRYSQSFQIFTTPLEGIGMANEKMENAI